MTHHFRQNLCAEISVIIRTLHIVLKFSPFKRSGSFSETATKGFLPDNERRLKCTESEKHFFVGWFF
jgi:hypothetical protein